MKKAIFSLAAVAMLLASCDTSVKDSTQSFPYGGINLIIDTYDLEQPAVMSMGTYSIMTNLSKGAIDIQSSDIIINNQKYSFETDTMTLHFKSYVDVDGKTAVTQSFGKQGQSAVGSSVTDLSGYYSMHYYRYKGDPNQFAALTDTDYQVGTWTGINMKYTISGRYLVQAVNTLWYTLTSNIFFRGNSYAKDETGSFSTQKTDYLLGLDLEKKAASLMIYHPEYSTSMPENYPKAIMIENIPMTFVHDGFRIEVAEPSTKVLTTVDSNLTFVENSSIKATDFSLKFISPDLSKVEIKYTIEGKNVSFSGSSTISASY